MNSLQSYHMLINNFNELNLRSCNYNYYQHNINLSYFLRKHIIKEENELGENFTLEKKSVVSYLKRLYHEAIFQINYYNEHVKVS